ncbi:CULLIN_2 domain-containing protein, partial [Haematococcus lacustris]
MLVDLGHQVYVDDFEKQFLETSAAFYKKEAAEYLATADCPSYLAKVERRLAEESERVKQYLDASTEPKITRVMEHELITQQVEEGSVAWGSSSARAALDS